MVQFSFGDLVCERFILGTLEVNTYLVYEKGCKTALVIDPAEESQILLDRIIELDLNDITIFLTHGHADHIAGVPFLQAKTGAKVGISKADATMITEPTSNLSVFIGDQIALAEPDLIINPGDEFAFDDISGTFESVPGHTPGGLVLIFDDIVFSGDTLFAGSIGRSDLPGGDGKALIESIKSVIFPLKDRLVLPGHGPETKIQKEKDNNPFLCDSFAI